MPAASKSKTLEELEEYFSFKIEDKTYVMPVKTVDVLTPAWVRSNRRRDEVDYLMTLFEAITGADPEVAKKAGMSKSDVQQGADIMKVLDALPWPEHRRVQRELLEHMGATLGE